MTRATFLPPAGERGAALLSVLLLVAIMAVIATTALDRIGIATRITAAQAASGQAAAYARAAELLAMRRIGDLVARDAAQLTLAGDWADRDFTVPVPGGTITTRARDGGNCFNLNGLAADTGLAGGRTTRQAGVQQLTALMVIQGVSEGEAQAIAAATADWIDSDQNVNPLGAEDAVYLGNAAPSRTADALFVDVSEWRAVRGVTPRIYARMQPWVCALPVAEMTALNANLLRPDQAPLLAMLAPTMISTSQARAALAARPVSGYGSTVRFCQISALAKVQPPPDVAAQVKVKSRWFAVASRVNLGDYEVIQSALVDAERADGAPTHVVRRQWGVIDPP
ncbi:MAG: Type secretion system protein [Pseudomonadota bacterium]